VAISSSDISLVPKATIALDHKASEQTLRLLDHLEELADVQKAYTNADFPPEVLEQYQESS
jgi:transcriptional/translational regulatory protein YebC/TACO1